MSAPEWIDRALSNASHAAEDEIAMKCHAAADNFKHIASLYPDNEGLRRALNELTYHLGQAAIEARVPRGEFVDVLYSLSLFMPGGGLAK